MTEKEPSTPGRAIDIDKIDLDLMREKTTEHPGLLPYAHTVGGAVIKPEDMGKTMARSLQAMDQQTGMQMNQIYQQMQLLADQAKIIQKRKEISEQIYMADLRFDPLIGHIYYFYRKEDKYMLSLIGPNEWGRSQKYEAFLAKVRLLADHTWDILEEGEPF